MKLYFLGDITVPKILPCPLEASKLQAAKVSTFGFLLRKSLFHRVMSISFKSESTLQFGDITGIVKFNCQKFSKIPKMLQCVWKHYPLRNSSVFSIFTQQRANKTRGHLGRIKVKMTPSLYQRIS